MNRMRALVMHEARLQFRYGIYYAYAFVIMFYITVIFTLGDSIPGWLAGLIIFSDPAAVGFFFLGALMLLEKSEGVRAALAVTPLSASGYFWAKCITLTSMACLAVIAVSLGLHESVNYWWLIPVVALTSVQYLALGVPIVRLFSTVTSYMMGAAFLLIPVVLPAIFALKDPMPLWAMFFPAAAQLKLIFVATGYGSASAGQIALMFAICALSAVLCVVWALRNLRTELGQK
ncbi:MAG: hypothetical protein JKX69_02790 [Rhodobacteraceae bacterium]|nr:hypothetical protein [Paracoccaceae bacterium]